MLKPTCGTPVLQKNRAPPVNCLPRHRLSVMSLSSLQRQQLSVEADAQASARTRARAHTHTHTPVRAQICVLPERVTDGEAVVGAKGRVSVSKQAARLLVHVAVVVHIDGHCQRLQHVVHDVVHAPPHAHNVQVHAVCASVTVCLCREEGLLQLFMLFGRMRVMTSTISILRTSANVRGLWL